jgi:Vacuolar protein sorting-associated protein 62
MRRLLLASALLLLPACGGEVSVDDSEDPAALTGDGDGDGIADSLESALAARFAPVVRLHPSDQNRPANVDWYLPRMHLRFSHAHCPDHQVLADGAVTETNLSQQSHPTDNFVCVHTSTHYLSNALHAEYFLQPTDLSAVQAGLATSGWRTYVHVKKSLLAGGAYDIQYWFFYAYDDGPLDFNHEADWEHITVTVDASQNFVSAWYAQHNSGTRYPASALTFIGGTHAVVYSANGTHASYPKAGSWSVTLGFTDYTADGGPSWDTGSSSTLGVVNVGEVSAPLSGQSFVRYGGRWGEIGTSDYSSGPLTPSFQSSWTTY